MRTQSGNNVCHNLRHRVVAEINPYRDRLAGGLVQQVLSVVGVVRDCTEFGNATDKR